MFFVYSERHSIFIGKPNPIDFYKRIFLNVIFLYGSSLTESSEKGTHTNESLDLKYFICAYLSDEQSAFDGL